MLKQVNIEVSDSTGKIGKFWEEGSTTVILSPNVPADTGRWKTERPGDLDSNGTVSGKEPKGLKRRYDFSTTEQTLFLRTYSEDKWDPKGKEYLRGEPVTTVLYVKDFDLNTPIGSSGRGIFPFRGKKLPVDWEVTRTVEVERRDPDPAPPKERVILGRTYTIKPDDRALIKRTTTGFQEYEYFDKHQTLLYVGRTGGEDGQKPGNWVDRLHKSHITTEWIGEAITVVVTYDLTLPEAMALEEVRIPDAKYNIKAGDYSSSAPDGIDETARSAMKHGRRETFALTVFPPPKPSVKK
jgi:hypothetical protein